MRPPAGPVHRSRHRTEHHGGQPRPAGVDAHPRAMERCHAFQRRLGPSGALECVVPADQFVHRRRRDSPGLPKPYRVRRAAQQGRVAPVDASCWHASAVVGLVRVHDVVHGRRNEWADFKRRGRPRLEWDELDLQLPVAAAPADWFSSVSCVSSDFCMAVGVSDLAPLAEFSDGSTWTVSTASTGSPGGVDYFRPSIAPRPRSASQWAHGAAGQAAAPSLRCGAGRRGPACPWRLGLRTSTAWTRSRARVPRPALPWGRKT